MASSRLAHLRTGASRCFSKHGAVLAPAWALCNQGSVRHHFARKSGKKGYFAVGEDWREWLPETQLNRLFYRFEKWIGERKGQLYPPSIDICNSGAKFGAPIPRPELVLRRGMPKGTWEWQMQLYGAALYWHLATTPGDDVAEVDVDMLRGKSVLEVACMRGGGARYLAEVTGAREYVAVDDSAENVELCNALHEPLPSALRFERAEVTGLAELFPAASFDAVLCVEAAEEFEDKARFLQGVAHVLRPGGRLILCGAFAPKAVKETVDGMKEVGISQEVCMDIGKWVRATGLSPVDIGESHSVFGVAPITYLRIVGRKM